MNENEISLSELFCLKEKPKFYKGYQNGYRQPVVKIILKTIDKSDISLKTLHQALHYYFNDQFSKSISDDLITCLAKGVVALQKAALLPIFADIQISTLLDVENSYEIWIPAFTEDCFHPAMAFMLDFCHRHIITDIFQPNNALIQHINELIAGIKIDAPKNANTFRFIEAAHQAGIAWTHIGGNIYQYGYGCHSRWFDDSFTENTSVISTRIARYKNGTTALLQRAGFPVPKQIVVYNVEEAIENANQIGYPVVIKPYNQDSGAGVFARLTNAEQVKRAFQQASKFSDIMLLEQHVAGNDYRLIVLEGQLIWAIERIPGGVKGDGVHSINELIEQHNLVAHNKFDITEDTLEFLAEQGCQLNSILENGKFIPINRIANISTGGTPVAVFNKVHPDNKMLAEAIAKLLRLDLVGIDFITPDIEKSYFEVGGAVIEVNAQPQFGVVTAAHIYKQILMTLIPHQGRIPIIAICNNAEQNDCVDNLTQILEKHFKHIGLVKNKKAFLDNIQICKSSTQFSAGEALLLSNQIELLIYCFDSNEKFEDGLPFEQYDYLILKDRPSLHCLSTLIKHCHHKIIMNDEFLEQIKLFNQAGVPSVSIKTFINTDLSNEAPIDLLLKNWLKTGNKKSV
ncbi:acetate--CoA ligase family protein [Candidatus Berkiella aquae]|nr:acetate--CoA ligase family protein [Candidatus Berkiella aquae]MCS5712189.1 acetate--CoA ligase family protein [Candidatus Berkiella aquae]